MATEDIVISDYQDRRITIKTQDGKNIRMQIPRMYMPFGVSGFVPDVGATKWNIDFSMKGCDEEDNYVRAFYTNIRDIENKLIASVTAQSEAIFKKQHPLEEVQMMFNSNIKETPGREPKFRVKVDTTDEGVIRASVFDQAKSPITTGATNGLYARNSGIAIIELAGVYFLNKKFGMTWKLHQLQVFEPQQLKGFQFKLP